MTVEQQRLDNDGAAWRRWGPYVSDRAWGTVREDYSAGGDAWGYFSHDQARSRTYRWSEDGIAGICDEGQHLCFALALWNGRDAILKERFFGLANPQGNHGEDVKEYYFYLDSTPTYSYTRMLYKYPHAAYPYDELVEVNARRTRDEPEYELVDTGIFADDRYFDVFVEYAKGEPDDILIRLSVVNRGPDSAELHSLPTLWFRDTWSWQENGPRPRLSSGGELNGATPSVRAEHPDLGAYVLYCEGADTLLFTENESNLERLYGVANRTPYVKDAFHEYLVGNRQETVNPQAEGTKAAAHYHQLVDPGEMLTLRLRLTETVSAAPFADFDEIFTRRQREADDFYLALAPVGMDEDRRQIQRQALAGMLWSKEFYHYDVARWLAGDPAQPPPPVQRLGGRNSRWTTLDAHDVISMPDKWEYPWFAAWDLAFHCLPLALVDVDVAKSQIELLLEDRFQHPNGGVPAYEWNFSDVNPPIIAWAALRVCQLEDQQRGKLDTDFLERVFHKLMLHFTWWVNREDSDGRNLFEGGFLGMDNIGIFDRDSLPSGYQLEQTDGTSWMAVFCQGMLMAAMELAKTDHAFEDIASKFFEHLLYIASAANNLGGQNISLWDDEDEFFYDVLRLPDGTYEQIRVRSLVGLTPLFTPVSVEAEELARFPDFRRRTDAFLARRPDLAQLIPVGQWQKTSGGRRYLLSLVGEERLRAILRRMLDPDEFLSDYGIRSISKYHLDHPYVLEFEGQTLTVQYEPAESRSGMFGGNSNWRGPIWLPMNYMMVDALRRFHEYWGDELTVECPTGSGNLMTLGQVADELSNRLIRIFTRDANGNRAFHGGNELLQRNPHWRDYILFNEYFHGDNGAGIGASHQTGWTGLVANLIQQQGERISPADRIRGVGGGIQAETAQEGATRQE